MAGMTTRRARFWQYESRARFPRTWKASREVFAQPVDSLVTAVEDTIELRVADSIQDPLEARTRLVAEPDQVAAVEQRRRLDALGTKLFELLPAEVDVLEILVRGERI